MVTNFKLLPLVGLLVFSIFFLSACNIFSGDRVISGIEIDDGSISEYFLIDEEADLGGIKVLVFYSDKTIETISYQDLEYISLDTTQQGKQNVNILYKSMTATLEVTILNEEEYVENLELVEGSIDKEFLQHDEFDFSSIKIDVLYKDDSQSQLSFDDVTLSEFDTETSGMKNLEVDYKGVILQIVMHVFEPIEYTVIAGTVAVEVEQYSNIDLTDIQVELEYSNGDSILLDYSDLNIALFSTDEPGEQIIEMLYYDFAINFQVNVIESTPDEIYYEENSMSQLYMVGDDLEYENLVVWASYPHQTVRLGYEDVDIFGLDNTKRGDQEVAISYKGKETSVNVKYYYEIISFDLPNFVEDYYFNISERENEETEFIDKESGYYVGSNNAFKFMPFALGGSVSLGMIEELLEFEMTHSFEIWDEQSGAWVNVDDVIDTYVEIDNTQGSFDFYPIAEDKVFKISVGPKYFPHMQHVEFEFKVVDAWNAYDVSELSMIDRNTDGAWANYKQLHGIDDIDISGIILHRDMNITANDIPEDYIHQSGDYAGSLKDWKSVYTLITDPGTRFDFIGNYFTIDASQIPLIEDGKTSGYDDEGIIAHSTLFGMAGDDDNIADDVFIGEVHVRNMRLRGNAPRMEDLKYSGGITIFRSSAEKFVMENTIIREALTIFTPLGQWEDTGEEYKELKNQVVLRKNRGYDSFSVMLYLWQSEVLIEDSVYKGSGGPVVIATHRNRHGNNDYDQYSSLTTINTIMETKVNGNEAWFQLNGATTMATQVSALAVAFDVFAQAVGTDLSDIDFESNSLLIPEEEADVFNVKGVIMESSLNSNNYINGSIDFNESGAILDKNNEFLKNDVFSQLSPFHTVLKSSNGGILSILQDDNTGWTLEIYDHNEGVFKDYKVLIDEGNLEPILKLFSGENIYLLPAGGSFESRMGLVLGYYKSD